jgi:hypothetical protein
MILIQTKVLHFFLINVSSYKCKVESKKTNKVQSALDNMNQLQKNNVNDSFC